MTQLELGSPQDLQPSWFLNQQLRDSRLRKSRLCDSGLAPSGGSLHIRTALGSTPSGVHNTEVAAKSLGLGLGESGGRSEDHEAKGGTNDVDQDDGLHVDILRAKSKRGEE